MTLRARRGRPPRRRRALRAWLAAPLVGFAALSGCSWFSSSEPVGPPPAACPSIVVLRPLRQTAIFAPGAAHQPTGVAFYGLLSDVNVKCDQTAAGLHAVLDIVVIGERGPAAGTGEGVDLQYFVAVTGPDQAILGKWSFAVRIPIPRDAKRAGVTDHIEETIPLAGHAPGDLNIVLGFQQSPEVVDFYRHFRGI